MDLGNKGTEKIFMDELYSKVSVQLYSLITIILHISFRRENFN